jgi:lysine-N-methylase
MPLPIVVLPQQEKWNCHQCGVCCRGSVVPLSKTDLAKLQSQRWEDDPDLKATRTTVRMGWTGPFRLAHRPDGSCVFLNQNGACRIHAKFGADAKPTICRVFPLQLVPCEHRSVLTMRRACPSAALDRGQDLKSQLPAIQELIHQGDLSSEFIVPPSLKHGEYRDWPTVTSVLELTAKLFLDQRYPPVRRVVHVLQWASLLAAAKTKTMSDSKVVELASTLAELAPEESKIHFHERTAPSRQGLTMFRQMGAEYARLHPELPYQRSVGERLRLMSTGWRIYRGLALHTMSPPFADVPLNLLDKPLGQIDPAIDRLLSRHLETLASSYLYAFADRQRWSLLESIVGLCSLFPVGLWLLRWIAHGRQPTCEDMVSVIVALDRGQGFTALSSRLQAWRLNVMAANGDLQRLAISYAQ